MALDDFYIETKEDSAAKLAEAAGKETKFYLFAEEFNSIRDYLNAVKTHVNNLISDSANKVDKVTGKSLLSDTEIARLLSMTAIFTTTLKNAYDGAVTNSHTHANKAILDLITEAFTTTLLTKLNGIATGATANSSDATLLNRANHTGSQLASTISDFTSAVNALISGLVVNTRTINSKPLSSDVVLTAADIGYNQVILTSSTTAQASWNGKVVKVRGNLTITIPATGLPTGYNFEFIVDPTFTLTWAIVTKTWVFGTPSTASGRTIGTILQDEQDDSKIYLLT